MKFLPAQLLMPPMSKCVMLLDTHSDMQFAVYVIRMTHMQLSHMKLYIYN